MPAPVLVPLQGGSAAAIIPLEATGMTLTDVHASLDMMLFDNLNNGSKLVIAAPAGAADAATQPNIDFNRNDGAIVRLTGQNLIVDGVTGSDITADGSGGTATHPTLTLVVNDSPSNRSDYSTWKSFILALPQLYTVPCLIVMPNGRDQAGSFTGIGFSVFLGKLTGELDLGVDGNTPKTLTLVFTGASGYSFDSGLVSTLTASGYIPTVTPVLGSAVDFPNLTSGVLDEVEVSEYAIL